jgi:hypothetical protein
MNNNLVRHLVLDNLVYSTYIGNLDYYTKFEIAEIEDLKSKGCEKRSSAIKYLIATKNLLPFPSPGTATHISLTNKGYDSFYSEHFKEMGVTEKQRFWNNAITLVFSGLVTFATIMLVFKDDKPNDLQLINGLNKTIQLQQQTLDSIRFTQLKKR